MTSWALCGKVGATTTERKNSLENDDASSIALRNVLLWTTQHCHKIVQKIIHHAKGIWLLRLARFGFAGWALLKLVREEAALQDRSWFRKRKHSKAAAQVLRWLLRHCSHKVWSIF